MSLIFSIGSSIVVEGARISGIFAGIIFNPLCFLLYEDLRLSPNDWTDVRFTISTLFRLILCIVYNYRWRLCLEGIPQLLVQLFLLHS